MRAGIRFRRDRDPEREPSALGRLVGTLFFLAFFGMGSFFLVVMGQDIARRMAPYAWESADCRILASNVATDGNARQPYRPAVHYEHPWRGEIRESTQVRRDDPRYDDYADARSIAERHPAGAVQPCFVSEQGEAVLERSGLAFAAFLLLPLLFVGIGLVGIRACWTRRPRDARGEVIRPPLSKRAKGVAGRRALVAFGALFALVGLGVAGPLLVVPLHGVWSAQSWAAHECKVVSSRVVSHRSDDGTTYSVDILYRYQADGAMRRSNRYSFFGGSSGGHGAQAEIVRAHPPGKRVRCWVDPHDADEAVIERGLTTQAFLALLPLAFVAIGGLIMWAGLRQPKAARRGASARVRPPAGSTGPIELEAQASPWGRLIGMIFACVFWNGIVAVFLREALGDHGSSFLLLFLIPFVLVGLALVAGVFHTLLALANPRPRLRAAARSVRLGERLELAWEISGRVERLERLRLYLEGREEAEYRRGTNTYTDREVFATIELVDLRDRHAMGRGTTVLEMPHDTIHSFEAAHNKIVWELKVEGAIPRWPDVDETFPIEVLPMSPDRVAQEAR